MTEDKGNQLERLLSEIRGCTLCRDLPLGPRPVLSASHDAPIMVCGQAPGTRVHESGIPFNDPSGDRLRAWMGIDREIFYNPSLVNIVPMGFCYPGRDPRGGDLPPRPECRATWHNRLFDELPEPQLKLVIGRFAHEYHLGVEPRTRLVDTVREWREMAPQVFPLPHPSPRNQLWLRRNPWVEAEVIPALQARVREILA